MRLAAIGWRVAVAGLGLAVTGLGYAEGDRLGAQLTRRKVSKTKAQSCLKRLFISTIVQYGESAYPRDLL